MNNAEYATSSGAERVPLPTQDSLGGPDGALQWIVDRLRSKMPVSFKEAERLKRLQELWSAPDPRLGNVSPRLLFDTEPDRVIRFIDELEISQ